MTTQTERASGMRDFKVHGEHVPVFRDQSKRWYDGDTIAEEDLLRIFTPAHIEMLVEGEGLEVLVAEDSPGEPQEDSGEAKNQEDPTGETQESKDPPGEAQDPEATGEPSLAEANAEASGEDQDPPGEGQAPEDPPAAEAQDPPVAGKKKGALS